MPFRYDEAVETGLQKVQRYLVPPSLSPEERRKSLEALDDVVQRFGPPVETYPTWHPLVSQHERRATVTTPSERSGYSGLDHTRYFVNAFITCPYGNGADEVIQSVEKLRTALPIGWIRAEPMDVTLYNKSATPVLVSWEADDVLEDGQMIPKSLAIPLMLQRELADWKGAQVGETWETMRYYLLGSPHGNRSSMFVSQETALALKKMLEALNASGMFGPIMPR